MSRSYLHHNIVPFTTCKSEKYDKRLANRRLRRKTKKILNNFYDLEEIMNSHFPLMREVSDVYFFNKDGRCVLDTGIKIFNSEGWEFLGDKNKYYGKYVTKKGHIRK